MHDGWPYSAVTRLLVTAVTLPTMEAPRPMTEHLQVPYRSIPDMFLQRVAATPAANAIAYPSSSGPVWLTWQAGGEGASAIAAGLHSIGVQPEDRVAIAANTRVEWLLADLGILCAGAATTTVYPTTEPKDAAFILHTSRP